MKLSDKNIKDRSSWGSNLRKDIKYRMVKFQQANVMNNEFVVNGV